MLIRVVGRPIILPDDISPRVTPSMLGAKFINVIDIPNHVEIGRIVVDRNDLASRNFQDMENEKLIVSHQKCSWKDGAITRIIRSFRQWSVLGCHDHCLEKNVCNASGGLPRVFDPHLYVNNTGRSLYIKSWRPVRHFYIGALNYAQIPSLHLSQRDQTPGHNDEKDIGKNEHSIEYDGRLIVRRFLILVSGFAVEAYCVWNFWINLFDGSRVVAAGWLAIGCLCAALGGCVWLATAFEGTRQWIV